MDRRPFLCTLALGLLFLGAAPAGWTQEVTYATGSWAEDGNGNHRAVVRVEQPAEAVRAHIEWRRRDRDPQSKDVRVWDLATGQRVLNVLVERLDRVAGDIVFQPVTVPGEYAVYYLPYTMPKSNFDHPGEYYRPEPTAAAEWLARLGDRANLPQAEVLRIEARSEFDRMDPMEIIATPEETAGLLAQFPGRGYLVFPEDRRRPIRMLDELPLCWVQQGPSELFTGEAQPGEYYCLQLGIWAARRAVGRLALDATDLRNAAGATIPSSQLTCINLGGTDWLGRPLTRVVTVPEGRVQPLWIGIDVPPDAAGEYTGTLILRPEGDEPWPVTLNLRVAGPVLEDGGVSDLWRMSRLKWLNSTLGIDDEVVPPFTPLKVQGNTISCLLREVGFGPLGLPERIVSSGREVLAAPLRFLVETTGDPVRFAPGTPALTRVTPGLVERVVVSASPEADLTVRCVMEADGCLMYTVTLEPKRTLPVTDIALEIPQRKDCAVYMMGLGKRGGYRPSQWRWKWDRKRANNMVWLGDVTAGMQLQLRGHQDVWEPVYLTPAGFAPSWDNDGRGGCDVTEEEGQVLVRAYTGARTLRPGQPLELRFRLLVTPFKPIDPNHWNWRYGDTNADATVLHIHHGTPENPYINYPFWKVAELTRTVDTVRADRPLLVDPGRLTYPAAGLFNPSQGSAHFWVTVDFDPTAGSAGQARYNQPLFAVQWPTDDRLGFYWNIDDRGMRVYVARGPKRSRQYPILLPSHAPGWARGQRHLISLSWGEEIAIFVDGVNAARAPFRGTIESPLDGAEVELEGAGFVVHALKLCDVPYPGGDLPAREPDEHTLLLDDFARHGDANVTRPAFSATGEGGRLEGAWGIVGEGETRGLHLTYRALPSPRRGVNVYYNVGQISNHVAELWAIRSLGDEIIPTHDTNPTVVGQTTFGKEGGGYPWLREHLVAGYVPAWRQPLPWLAETCAAIEMQPLSRWHNYYVEGLNWLMRTTGVDGLYLDGISYDREITKRVAKVMLRNEPQSRINCHGGDSWSPPWDPDRRVSTANAYLEHFPYLSNLWFGELYDYNLPPDYWLVEVSGIPFGLTGEMLNYETGGNPYRGMVFGMTGRLHPSCHDMWRLWDQFGIQDAEWLGYWNPQCPVKTDNPAVLATVYRKPGRALVALAHWPAPRERPSAVARRTAAAPTIDGVLEEGEWDAAARLTGFTIHDDDRPAPDQTEVYVTWDEASLYVAFRCVQPGGNPKAEVRDRDGATWTDDAVELFFQPDRGRSSYFQFIGNSVGAFYDARGSADPGWDADWTYRTATAPDSWTGEVSVPLSSLGIPPGTEVTLGFNACRDQARPTSLASCWAPISGSFHNPDLFGALTLSHGGQSTRDTPVAEGARRLAVHLRIDWEALGLDPRRAILTAPAIEAFQPRASYLPDQAIVIEPAGGALLMVQEGG